MWPERQQSDIQNTQCIFDFDSFYKVQFQAMLLDKVIQCKSNSAYLFTNVYNCLLTMKLPSVLWHPRATLSTSVHHIWMSHSLPCIICCSSGLTWQRRWMQDLRSSVLTTGLAATVLNASTHCQRRFNRQWCDIRRMSSQLLYIYFLDI